MIDKIEGPGLIYFNEMFVVSESKIQLSTPPCLAGQCRSGSDSGGGSVVFPSVIFYDNKQ